MGLPVLSTLATSTVAVAGVDIPFHALSRSAAIRLNGFKGRLEDVDVFILQHGTDCTEEEAQAFVDNNDLETAGLLIDAILAFSGLATKVVTDADGDEHEEDDPKT